MIYRFTLTYNSVDTEVCEPQGWDSFKSELKRDFKSHGVVFKYTSGTLKLGFADGRDILEAAFRLEGFDAQVTLTVDQRADAFQAWEEAFSGIAVMKNRELNDLYFSVDFEGSSFQQKIINRLKTTLRVNSATDLDGNALTPITALSTTWNTIRFNYIYRGNTQEDYTMAALGVVGAPAGDVVRYTDLNFNDTQIRSLDNFVLLDKTTILNSSIPAFLVEPQINGDLVFTTLLKRHVQINIDSTTPGDNTVLSYQFYLRHLDSTGTLITQYTLYDTGNINSTEGTNYDFGEEEDLLTQSITGVNQDDQFVVYAKISGGAVIGTPTVDLTWESLQGFYVDFNILQESLSFEVNYYMVYEFIDHLINIASGSASRLRSDFLDRTDRGAAADGCGGLNMIANGYFLRGIADEPEATLKDTLDSILAIYGLGWGFEYDSGYYIRIEPMEYFYTDNEILDLGSPVKELDSYTETSFDDLLINNVKVGYKKFSKDETISGDRDDFLSQSEYSLPISTVEGSYNRISKIITSGRLIQATFETRRDTSKSWKLDKDIFMIAASRSGATFIPENDENFESINGIDNVSTAYNIRFAPVYNFLNHALIVNSALKGKSLSDLIINVSADVNKDFNATFSSYEVCLLGDSQRLQRSSVGNIAIGDNYEGLRLFEPVQHELTVAMSATQLTLIINAMENNSADPTKNFGYLTYRDSSGNVQTGFPLTITWNPNDEIAEITTLEKADNYGI